MYPAQLSQIVEQAIARLHQALAQSMPLAAPQIEQWLSDLAGQRPLPAYFMHPVAFPALLLPWWAEQQLHSRPDLAFQAKLAYSTVNGYLYIRLIDNIMDGDTATKVALLPSLGFFHTQFQQAYTPTFAHDHPFWQIFGRIWFHSAQVTMIDAQLTTINAEQFRQVAAQKVCAAKIPLTAVCYYHNCPDLMEPWLRVVELLGCWHQMGNDIFGWLKDEGHGNNTYFLSEANCRRHGQESIAAWLVREGLAWGMDSLNGWMAELKALAGQLNSHGLQTYLARRQEMLLQQQAKAAKGLTALTRLSQQHHRAERESTDYDQSS